jgi:hypothetical protein
MTMSEPLEGETVVGAGTSVTLDATVTVNQTDVTVDPGAAPFVVGTFNTQVVYAGNTTNVGGTVTTLTTTTYLVTFTQGGVTFTPTFTLPANFGNPPVSVGPATVTPTGGSFVLTCVDGNAGNGYVVRQFVIPTVTSDGGVLTPDVMSPPADPTMIFNPPRGE